MQSTRPSASVQLIIFGDRTAIDLEGVLTSVAKAGYAGIECGNLFASHGEDAVRRLLDQTGLKVSGVHTGFGDYVNEAALAANMAFAKAVGASDMMCSGIADPHSAQGYKDAAAVFNRVGAQLAENGLRFNYHNHAWEFDQLPGGSNGMHILDDRTDAALVKFNIDVFWVWYAGLDPAEFIMRHGDRAGYFHFKDGTRETSGGKQHPAFTELGRGRVNLLAAATAARQVGARWLVAEQDSTKLAPTESITISREYMQRTLGI